MAAGNTTPVSIELQVLGASAVQRGFNTTTTAVQGFGTAANTTSARMGNLRTSAVSVTDSFQKMALTLGATAAALAFFVNTAHETVTFQKTMSAVQAITSATTDEFAMMEAESRRLGATTVYTATQAAEGMKQLAMAGFGAEKSTANLGTTLTLAQAGGLELADATEIAANLMATFGLNTEQTIRAVDVLATTANSSNTNVAGLGISFKYAGPLAAALGLSLEEVAAALGVLGNAGLKAEMGGTALRQVLAQLSSESSKGSKILKEMGVAYAEINPQANSLEAVLKRLQKANIQAGDAFRIFGARGVSGFLNLMRLMPQFEDLKNKINNSAGAAKEMAQIMGDNVWGNFKAVTSAVEDLAITVAKAGLEQNLMAAMQALTGFLREAQPILARVTPGVLEFAGAVAKVWLAMKALQFGLWLGSMAAMGVGLAKETALLLANTVSWGANSAARTAAMSSSLAGAFGGSAAGLLTTPLATLFSKSLASAGVMAAVRTGALALGASAVAGIAGWQLGSALNEAFHIDEGLVDIFTKISGAQQTFDQASSKTLGTLAAALRVATSHEEKTLAIAKLEQYRASLVERQGSALLKLGALASPALAAQRDMAQAEIQAIDNMLAKADQLAGTQQKGLTLQEQRTAEGRKLTAEELALEDAVENTNEALEDGKDIVKEIQKGAEAIRDAWKAELPLKDQLTAAKSDMDGLLKDANNMLNLLRGQGRAPGESKGNGIIMNTKSLSNLEEVRKLYFAMLSNPVEFADSKELLKVGTLLEKMMAAQKDIKSITGDITDEKEKQDKKDKDAADKAKKQAEARAEAETEIAAIEAEAGGNKTKADALKQELELIKTTAEYMDSMNITQAEAEALAKRKIAAEQKLTKEKAKQDLLDRGMQGTVDDVQEVGGGGGRFGLPDAMATAFLDGINSGTGQDVTTPEVGSSNPLGEDGAVVGVLTDIKAAIQTLNEKLNLEGLVIQKR